MDLMLDSPDPIVATLRDRQQRERQITVRDRHGNSYYGRIAELADGLVRIHGPYHYGMVSKEWTLRIADVVSVEDNY